MKKKSLVLMTSLLLVALLIAGGTMAWFTATAPEVENKFTAGTLEIELVDDFEDVINVNPGDCFDKEVYVKNIGTKRALVRIEKDIAFDNADLDIDVVEYVLGEGWEEIDGYFYYDEVVQANGQTGPLFANNQVCFNGPNMDNDYQGAELTITINADAIQATNGAPTAEGWAIDPLAVAGQ